MDPLRAASVIIFLLILFDMHGQGTYAEEVAGDYQFF